MNTSAEAVLLGDIGATNARFPCLVEGALGPIKWIEVASHLTIGDAIVWAPRIVGGPATYR
jgi:hypothetical protein